MNSTQSLDFDYLISKCKMQVVEDVNCNPMGFKTLQELKLIKKPAFILKGDLISLVSKAYLMGQELSLGKIQQYLCQYGGVALPIGVKSFSFVDCPIRKSWLQSSVFPRKEINNFEAVFVFGSHITMPHVDQGAASFCYTTIHGVKEWIFWSPGPEPLSNNRDPDFYVKVEKGDTIFGLTGWWHAVRTISNGAIHIGTACISRQSILSFKRSALSLKLLGEDIEKESQIILKTLREPYSVSPKCVYVEGGPAYHRLCELAAKYCGGTTRRSASGRKRRKKIDSRVDKRRSRIGSVLMHSWVVQCVCGKGGRNYDDGLPMIVCLGCNVWVHLACVFTSKASFASNFYCRKCKLVQNKIAKVK